MSIPPRLTSTEDILAALRDLEAREVEPDPRPLGPAIRAEEDPDACPASLSGVCLQVTQHGLAECLGACELGDA